MRAFILSAFLSCYTASGFAQTFKPPTGAAFDALVKEYTASFGTGSPDGLRAKLPAMEKAYPDHPYTVFFQAFLMHITGDETGALRSYSEAIRLMPEFSDPYPMRATLFADKGMYMRAEADMSKAIEIEGENAGAGWYSDRGDYRVKTGNSAGALEDFKMAVSKNPADARYYRGVVSVAIMLDRASEADAMLNAALAGAQKGNAGVRLAYADLLLRQQKFGEADAQYKQALTTAGYKGTSKDYNSAGIAAYKLKEYGRAATLLNKATELDPTDAEILCNLASVAMDEGKWEEVYTYAHKALDAQPSSPMANMMMAVGVKRTGRGDALAAQYEETAKKLAAEQGQ